MIQNREYVALGYIVDRTHKRIANGERAGEAAMNSIASLDPDLYAKLLKEGLNYYHADELALEELWTYLLNHYKQDAAWK